MSYGYGRTRTHGVCEQDRIRENIRCERRSSTSTSTSTIIATTTSVVGGSCRPSPASTASVVAAATSAHLGKNSKSRTKMFFARTTPTLFPSTIQQQIPLPLLNNPPHIV